MHAPLVTNSPGMVLWSEPQMTGSRWQVEPETWGGFVSVFNAHKPRHVTMLGPPTVDQARTLLRSEAPVCVQSACSTLPKFKS